MEEADLFIDDIDGIFDDEDDADEDEHASFGDDEDDIHDSSTLAIDACSSFPLMMEEDDDDEEGEGHHLSANSTYVGSMQRRSLPPLDEERGAIRDSTTSEVQHASNIAKDLGGDHLASATRPDSSNSAALELSAAARAAPTRQRSVSEPGAATAFKHKSMGRSGKHLEAKVCPLPPPSWHSEAADRHRRQAMILEIARLLQARKKTVPSSEWLRQLPHKARKLEERLYRSATSLEAYLDKATLKTRLKKLARVITRQFEQAKRQRAAGSATSALGWNQQGLGPARHRGSDASAASIAASVSSMASLAASSINSSSSLRDSFSTVNSIDSLRSFREALVRQASTGRTDSIKNSTTNGIDGNTTSIASLPTGKSTGGEGRPSSATADRPSDADPSVEVTKSGATTTAPTSSSSTPLSSPSQPTGIPSPPLSGTVLSAPGEGIGTADPEVNSVESGIAVPSFAHANGHTHQHLHETIRKQQEDSVRRSQGPPAGVNGPANSVPALTRSSSNGYNRAVAAAAVPATTGPVQAPSAPFNRPLPMFNGIGATGPTPESAAANMHGMSNLQMSPNMLAAAMFNQRMNGAGGVAVGGPAFSSMTSMGGPTTASVLHPQHLAAKGALHPSVLASMSNRSMLQQAFLEATAQSLGPNFFGSANPSQLLSQEQQRQLPFPPLYQGTPLVPDNSLLFGAPAPHFEPLIPSGTRPTPSQVAAHANSVGHPSTLSARFSQLQPPQQGPAAPRSLAQPPTTHPTKAGTSEDSEPLSPSSFNW